VIGGLVTSAFGWRAIFGVNLPIVVAVIYVLQRRIPRFDAAASDQSSAAADTSGRLFSGVFGAAFSTQALSTFAQYTLLIAVPIVLDSRGWSAAAIGVAVSCATIGMVVTGPYGGRLGDTRGRRRPVVSGLAVSGVAIALSGVAGDDVPSAILVVTLLLFGLGLGAATPSILTAGIEAAPLARAGSAAGLLSSSRYVGSIASTLVLARVLDDDGTGFASLLIACVAILAVSMVVARRLPGRFVGAPDLVP
jgi:MFS family permease